MNQVKSGKIYTYFLSVELLFQPILVSLRSCARFSTIKLRIFLIQLCICDSVASKQEYKLGIHFVWQRVHPSGLVHHIKSNVCQRSYAVANSIRTVCLPIFYRDIIQTSKFNTYKVICLCDISFPTSGLQITPPAPEDNHATFTSVCIIFKLNEYKWMEELGYVKTLF